MSEFPKPKFDHRSHHPFLMGNVSVWRVVLRDEDGGHFTRWVSAKSAKTATDFCDKEYTGGEIVSVTEAGPLDITGETLSDVVRVYEDRTGK